MKTSMRERLHGAVLDTLTYVIIICVIGILLFGIYDMVSMYIGRTFAFVTFGIICLLVIFLDKLVKRSGG
jgi:hypothetical protein